MRPKVLIILPCLLAVVLPTRAATPAKDKATTQPAAPVDGKEQMRKLWQANAQAPTDVAGAEKLRQAVEKLRAIELSDGARRQERADTAQTAPATASQPATRQATDISPQDDVALLTKLKAIPTTGAMDLVKLADSLFAAGHVDAAASFYELALERSDQEQGRDWLLFQIGNCHRAGNPAAARAAYQRLMKEFPDSPWKSIAATRDKLIEWNQSSNPRNFLAELKSEEPPATQPAEVAGIVAPPVRR
jgi:tetratricopeptide (TPR) repeat protein